MTAREQYHQELDKLATEWFVRILVHVVLIGLGGFGCIFLYALVVGWLRGH